MRRLIAAEPPLPANALAELRSVCLDMQSDALFDHSITLDVWHVLRDSVWLRCTTRVTINNEGRLRSEVKPGDSKRAAKHSDFSAGT